MTLKEFKNKRMRCLGVLSLWLSILAATLLTVLVYLIAVQSDAQLSHWIINQKNALLYIAGIVTLLIGFLLVDVIAVIWMLRASFRRNQAEQNAQHAAELQQIILNAIPAPIFFKDAAGLYRGCNAAFADYIGLKHEQIVGHTVFDVAPPDKARIYAEADNRLLQTGGIQIYEAPVQYADGSNHDIVFHKAVYQNPDGTVGGIVGNMLDVTGIRRAEAALLESEQSYREIFNASSEAIVLRDVESGQILDVNRSMLEMYGYSYEEALQLSFADLSDGHSPYTGEAMQKHVEQAIAGRAQLFEWRVKNRDGVRFWVEIAMKRSTIRGQERILSVARDIDERKKAEQAQKESEKRFQMLMEHAADSLFLHDENGCILDVNQRACDCLGYDRLELIGMTIDQVDDGLSLEVLQQRWRKLTIGKSSSIVTEQVKKSGERFPVEVNVVRFESLGTDFFLALARDITERKAAEAELERYRGQLEELVRERTEQLEVAQHELVARERLAVLGQLTATVSHELRNPLGTVKNALYLLGRIKADGNMEKIDKAIDLADRNISRCDSIINELLDYSRQQKGGVQKIDLGRFTQEILDEQSWPEEIALE
ncbi:MAG: PAS domain S-box protein, partial [Desulfuromonadales bacterium]|nr:PAS domain S-box protein [Desulfuromonadales bacterium]